MPAANTIPTDALVKVLTALVKHAPFETAGQAGRALMGCGLVCKTWQEAASHDAVWRALFLRCSPALVRARDGALPEPVLDGSVWYELERRPKNAGLRVQHR